MLALHPDLYGSSLAVRYTTMECFAISSGRLLALCLILELYTGPLLFTASASALFTSHKHGTGRNVHEEGHRILTAEGGTCFDAPEAGLASLSVERRRTAAVPSSRPCAPCTS